MQRIPAAIPASPPSAREWGARHGLLELIKNSLQAVSWPGKGAPFSLAGQTFPSDALMQLEVYCYARGIFNSQEMENFARKDPALRELFPRDWPEPNLIKKFRRSHRAPIQECLHSVFHQAFLARFGEPNSELFPVDHCVAMALDEWFEPVCGPQPEAEAAARLDSAIFWDGVSG